MTWILMQNVSIRFKRLQGLWVPHGSLPFLALFPKLEMIWLAWCCSLLLVMHEVWQFPEQLCKRTFLGCIANIRIFFSTLINLRPYLLHWTYWKKYYITQNEWGTYVSHFNYSLMFLQWTGAGYVQQSLMCSAITTLQPLELMSKMFIDFLDRDEQSNKSSQN